MAPRASSSGVITITTDFGHKGPFIGTMKGVMLSRFPDAKIVDLTHETLVHWPAEAGFWLSRAYRYFPKGTVHVAVVDPGVGTQREIIAVSHDQHTFLAPDNGLLGSILRVPRDTRIHRLDLNRIADLIAEEPSATFHGRDIFAPVAAALASDNYQLEGLGPEVSDFVPSWVDEPTVTAQRVSGVVITIDTFGNLVTNIDRRHLAALDTPLVRAGGHAFSLRRTYGEAAPGKHLALINSFGVLEIATAEGSAATSLGIERGAPVIVTDAAKDERTTS